mmetsp:Transcript_34188/g.30928  ORF Transcript_34188/g.30928 Transcript_34188/m.30928 type:complete len:116 (-) Transcript_34188:2116-2463(-)
MKFVGAARVDNVKMSSLNFFWSVAPTLNFTSFSNQFQFIKIQTLDLSEKSMLTINVQATNGSKSLSATYSIPINTPPEDGSIEISPASGESLTTKFQISAPDWDDDDLPLSYQFL